MVKFIDYWMFAMHLWRDSTPTPTVINMREISHIEEMNDHHLGSHVIIFLKNNDTIPIEGEIIEVLAAFQKHLQTIY